MKVRKVKETGHVWYDFKIPREYDWHTGISCPEAQGEVYVYFASWVVSEWKLSDYWDDLIDPIAFVFDEIVNLQHFSSVRLSSELSIHLSKERSKEFIQLKKGNTKEKINQLQTALKNLEALKPELPESFSYEDDLKVLEKKLTLDSSKWDVRRAGKQIPLRIILSFLWDRLGKTQLNNIDKRRFILTIFKELDYKDYSTVSEKTALKRIYQILYRADR